MRAGPAPTRAGSAPPTPRSATSRRSGTAARSRSSRRTAPCAGCRSPRSTRRPCSARFSMRDEAAGSRSHRPSPMGSAAVPPGHERPGDRVRDRVGRRRVTDAMTLPLGRGLSRSVSSSGSSRAIAGKVAGSRGRSSRASATGRDQTTITTRGGMAVAAAGGDAIAESRQGRGSGSGRSRRDRRRTRSEGGLRSLLALSFAHQEPLVFPTRDDVERRLEATTEHWRGGRAA